MFFRPAACLNLPFFVFVENDFSSLLRQGWIYICIAVRETLRSVSLLSQQAKSYVRVCVSRVAGCFAQTPQCQGRDARRTTRTSLSSVASRRGRRVTSRRASLRGGNPAPARSEDAPPAQSFPAVSPFNSLLRSQFRIEELTVH